MHRRGVAEVTIGVAVSAYGLVSLAARLPAGALYRTNRAWSLIAGGCLVSSASFAAMTQTANPALLTMCVALDEACQALKPV